MINRLIHLSSLILLATILISVGFSKPVKHKHLTYYINATKGNDNSSGLSAETPWTSLNKINKTAFKSGDRILLKRDEVWNESLIFKSSGDSLNPIIIGAYGKGEKPIITRMDPYRAEWEKFSQNIWKTSCEEKYKGKWNAPWRMLIEENEILLARNMEELDGNIFKWFYNKDTNEIYLYSKIDPKRYNIRTNLTETAALFSNVHDIIVRNIEFRGGYYRAIGIENNCNNISIINCKAGKYSKMGIAGSNFKNCIIDSCIIDSGFEFEYKSNSQRGTHDGIGFWGAIENCEVKNSTIRNWGHTCITLSSVTGSNKYNKIHDCLIESPDLPYGRALETDGSETKYNEFYNNILRNLTVRSQIGGSYNHYHHNLIYNYTNSLVKSYGTAQAFSLQGIGADATGNIMEFNIFANLDEAAIQYIGDWGGLKGNIFRNNIIYNSGRNPVKKKDKNIAIMLPKNKKIDYQIFKDNQFYNSETEKIVNYKGQIMTIQEFNSKNGNEGDVIIKNSVNASLPKNLMDLEIKLKKGLMHTINFKVTD